MEEIKMRKIEKGKMVNMREGKMRKEWLRKVKKW
jgi:hypothetical protein